MIVLFIENTGGLEILHPKYNKVNEVYYTLSQ